MKIAFALIFVITCSAALAPVARSGWLDDWAKMKVITPNSYIAYRADSAISIDGKLDERCWQNVPWTEYFSDIEGTTKPKPKYSTRAKMLWDDSYLYIGAELEEPHVWATLTEHDSVIFNDNDFEIFIDPNGDNHEYYEIEINALGTEWDLLLIRPYKDGGPAVNSWEIPGLKVGVHVEGSINAPRNTDKGWSVEVAIPWKVLSECARKKAPPQDGDQWRVNFSRVEWQVQIVDGKYQKVPGRREDNWIWSPQGIIDMHRPEKWGYVQFSTAPVGKATFQADPAAGARMLLQEIYYAQRDYKEKHGSWARKLSDLNVSNEKYQNLVGAPEMQVTQSLFEAAVRVKYPDGKTVLWHIRQDSRIWSDS